MNDVTDLHLHTTPKRSHGWVEGERGKLLGTVYEDGEREEARQQCIEQAQELINLRGKK
ncbi:hypothetical protein QUA62_26610 [Microcoleus sp. MON1_C1]|uniref:hypothetical protein n=1 Tax=Microcoleus sp. MON1_C1 TaxID=2818827 RepID=UPI002FCF4241